MKYKILSFCLAICCLLSVCANALDPFAFKTSLSVSQGTQECRISVYSGDVLEFTAADLERRLGLAESELGGITITSLPQAAQGELILDGIEVDVREYLDRAAIDRLCFVPRKTSAVATMSFLPQSRNAVTTTLSIHVLSAPNNPPELNNQSITTLKNVPVTEFIAATDPDGDALRLEVLSAPKKGTVTLDGQRVTYTPFLNKTGTDSFTVCAVDSYNAYSREAIVSVTIERTRASFSYADMLTHPSQYAALKLHEKNVYTGDQIGKAYFFHPNRQMTRGEFLVLTLSAAGMDQFLPASVNTGLPNDAQIPAWLKPYIKKAIDERILSSAQAFRHDEIPTRAEAVVYTHRASKIDDVKDYPLQMGDASSIPDWAVRAYIDLSAYRMLDLHDGNAWPKSALTNSYAADLTWQLYKHTHR